MKAFLVNVNRCNGCYCCQVACKDEHCNQPWLPYAEAQPLTGQFWMHIEETERGKVPWTRVTYVPHIDGQSSALLEAAGECAYQRDDGIVILDPAKAKGRKDLAELPGVYWNEELEIPQTCTGCAHLLDNGWKVPRCVDACPTEALKFVDKEDVPPEAETLAEGSLVFYLNLPKRFVVGTFFDDEAQEVIIGAKVSLKNAAGEVVAEKITDAFGDAKFDQVEAEAYTVVVEAEGYQTATYEADATKEDVVIGDQPLARQ